MMRLFVNFELGLDLPYHIQSAPHLTDYIETAPHFTDVINIVFLCYCVALLLVRAPSIVQGVNTWQIYGIFKNCNYKRGFRTYFMYVHYTELRIRNHVLHLALSAASRVRNNVLQIKNEVFRIITQILHAASMASQSYNQLVDVITSCAFEIGTNVLRVATVASKHVILVHVPHVFGIVSTTFQFITYQNMDAEKFAWKEDVTGEDSEERSGIIDTGIEAQIYICKTEQFLTENVQAKKEIHGRKRFTRRNRNKDMKRNQHSYRQLDLMKSFERVAEAIFKLMNGKVPLITPFKKALILSVLIMCGLVPANASPVQSKESTERRGLFEYSLLLTSDCHFRDIISSSTCHINQESLKIYINHCEFAKQCDPGFEPVCVDSVDGMLFICSPENLTCARGYRRRAWLNETNSNIVLVQEEKCPDNTYELYESYCYEACMNEQEDIKFLPAQFAIYSMGDNTSPPWIYCDFENGFYNRDGKSVIMYDRGTKYQLFDFCTNIDDDNPCTSGEYPLPNGTCVTSCMHGKRRDAYYGFQCTVPSGDETGPRLEWDMSAVTVKVFTRTTDVNAQNYGEVHTTSSTTQDSSFQSKKDYSRKLDNLYIAFIIVVSIIALVLLLIFGAILVHVWRTNRRKSVRINNNSRTENKTSIDKVETVNIYQTGNARKGHSRVENVTQPMLGEGEDV